MHKNSSEPIKVIVIDLNQTFYSKSSKDEFFKFICSKHPGQAKYIFGMAYYKLLKKLKMINQTEFKENFFNYLNNISPEQVHAYAKEFWQKEFPLNFNQKLLEHLDNQKKEGVEIFCATGALELYVKPLFDIYKINGVAGTKVKYINNTYLIEGDACKGKEKTRRLDEHYRGRNYKIVETYSDRYEDLFEIAEKAFMVKNGNIIEYN